ncbi:MAG: nucleoside triphosphate pyrophosphohydrolase [Sphingomonadaceae bacterium]
MVKNQTGAEALFGRLIAVMDRLRGPDGCPWDRAQDFASIAPYTLEEAHEVVDAIQRGDMGDLCDELGDLLLQVVFHARMATEEGHFTIGEVVSAIITKMERRHPHIFGPDTFSVSADTVREQWEEIKAAEKPRESVLDGIALTLPALTRARKLSSRAARTGFDWPDKSGPRAKIDEELQELEHAENREQRQEEAGDLLFSVVNYLRHLDIDPEAALREANAKFESRFRQMEKAPGFRTMSPDEQELLWQKAKMSQ